MKRDTRLSIRGSRTGGLQNVHLHNNTARPLAISRMATACGSKCSVAHSYMWRAQPTLVSHHPVSSARMPRVKRCGRSPHRVNVPVRLPCILSPRLTAPHRPRLIAHHRASSPHRATRDYAPHNGLSFGCATPSPSVCLRAATMSVAIKPSFATPSPCIQSPPVVAAARRHRLVARRWRERERKEKLLY